MLEKLNYTERNHRNTRFYYDIKTHEEREIEYERLNKQLNEILYQLVLLRHSDEMIYDDCKCFEQNNDILEDSYYEYEPHNFQNDVKLFNQDEIKQNENHLYDDLTEKHQAFPLIAKHEPYQVCMVLFENYFFLAKSFNVELNFSID